MTKYCLAVLTSHPIQYQAPLFKMLAQHPEIDLMVYFCSDHGVTDKIDPGFGVSFKWDIPLLEGYRYKFLKNYLPGLSGDKLWLSVNPGIIKELWKGKYDAIIIHGYASIASWLALLVAWLTKTPIMFRGETVLRPNRPWWLKIVKYILLKFFFQGINAFLTIGSRSEQFYRYYNIPQEKLFFTPYSVDNEYFINQSKIYRSKKEGLKKKEGIPEILPTILYVGKLVERKRPLDLLIAFSKIINRASLVFIGEGKLKPVLEKYVQDKAVKNVFFIGFVNQSMLPKYYSIGDIFVLPSSSQEVSPLVINEAMCCELPIITTDAVPSAIDFVKHGRNGFIYPVGDIDSLVIYLDELLSDPGKHQKMGKSSLEIISNWNYEACVMGILQALEFCQNMRRYK